MIQLVFMTEEPSMEQCLNIIVPKLIPSEKLESGEVTFVIIPHEGKQDLERSIPRKLRAWKDYEGMKYKFIVLRDQDNCDCIKVKENLVKLSADAGRPDTLVRIVCRELESWFLGDLDAVTKGLQVSISKSYCHKFKNPDNILKPSEELNRIHKGYRKIDGARKISQHLNLEKNNSQSFNVFLSGMNNLLWTIWETET
ncbi:MAG: hypothetical protein PWQ63_995 [Methanolobus sp.]|nr:hypothetical protein [Methanolobus sp.]MDK2947835.1 hypothetical protein [Methanolobus sp.]